jgi:hypothetical protein
MTTTDAPQNPDRISVFTDRPILRQGDQSLIHECLFLRMKIFGVPQNRTRLFKD